MIWVCLKFSFSHFSTSFFSVGGTLHVAYKKYKINRKFTFYWYWTCRECSILNSVMKALHVRKRTGNNRIFLLVNTKCISSCELKTSECLLVLRTRKSSYVFNTLHEIYLVFTSKSIYPIFNVSLLYMYANVALIGWLHIHLLLVTCFADKQDMRI